jgi:hypothetical protein
MPMRAVVARTRKIDGRSNETAAIFRQKTPQLKPRFAVQTYRAGNGKFRSVLQSSSF